MKIIDNKKYSNGNGLDTTSLKSHSWVRLVSLRFALFEYFAVLVV